MWVVDLRVLDWITGEESSLYESSLLRRDRVQGYPTISPDSRWLLFSAFLRDLGAPGCPMDPGTEHDWQPAGCNYLYLLELGADSPTRITDEPGKMNQGLGSSSPDLSMIAYVRRPQHGYSEDDGVLMVMRPDGSEQKLLHKGPVGKQISWSPDSSVIMFSHSNDSLDHPARDREPRATDRGRVFGRDLTRLLARWDPGGLRRIGRSRESR